MSNASSNGRLQGTVKWFSPRKGYGFIVADGSHDEYIAHYTAIDGHGYRNLEDGEQVTFRPYRRDEGLAAADIRPQHPTKN